MANQSSSCGSIPGANFFGASVVDFNASAGWGAQSSEVTINLVADCAEAFLTPLIGQAATFVMGNFKFSGLVQSWNSKSGSDGQLYTVKLISPHPILDNTQVILDHYEGKVPFFNLINVYGFLESLGGDCAQKTIGGTVFGAPAGGFGNSDRTSRGIPWYRIQEALQALTGGMGSNPKYCQGLAFKNDKYILDLSSIPIANRNYRLTGPVMSLTEIINQVCEDAGCDYYIQMFPLQASFAAGKYVIKVVTIPRGSNASTVPAVTGVDTFVQGATVINKAVGRELRSEVNSSLLIGGKVKQYYQCTNQKGMTPFWGWDAEGKVLKARQTDASELNWEVELDFRKINLALNFPVPADKNWVGENELRAAAGNYESFQKLIQNPGNKDSALYKYFTDTLGIKLTDVVGADPNAQDNAINIRGHGKDNDPTGDPASKQLRDAKSLHHWLSSYASDVYGKQFLVYFSLDSVVCRSVDSETEQVTYSDIVSTDGAWPSYGDEYADAKKIFGMENPSIQTDHFKDESGKVQPLVHFSTGDSKLNTKGLSNDSFIADDQTNDIWIKATVDEKWVIGTPSDPEGTKDSIRGALITLSNGVIDVEADEPTIESNRPMDVFKATGKPTANIVVKQDGDVVNSKKSLGGQEATIGALGPAYKLDPKGIGVPLQSTTNCYGPWEAVGADPGSTHAEVDEGLVPWEYGGFKYMMAAGSAKINDSVTFQQEASRGEVTVPGLPTLSIATNLNGQSVSSSYDVNRFTLGGSQFTSYNYSSTLAGGDVISNISVSVGSNGVTTTYTVNSFTPVFGRFSKGNADRLKQIGLNRQKGEREMRARTALRNLIRASERRTGTAGAVAEDIGKGEIAPKSSSMAFVGKFIANSTSSKPLRKVVVSPTKTTLPFYAESEADKTAMMTMDGFFRPVQIDMSDSPADKGDLPKVVKDTGGCDSLVQASAPPPPVMTSEEEDVEYLNISSRYLNFLQNPKPDDHSNVNTSWVGEEDGRAASSTGGHDIEGVARGTAGTEWDSKNPGKLLMQSGGMTGTAYATDYNDHYRFMALRGPLMIHGWGYDINGKPVPNKGNDSVGSFKTTYAGLKNEFTENWLEDSRTWPVAPVDLRFDRQRGVWTTPSAFRLYQIEVSGDIGPGSYGKAIVSKTISDITDGDGSSVATPLVEVENWTNTQILSGSKAMAYYDTAECKYWIIPPPSGASGVLKVGTSGCCTVDDSCYPCTGLTGCFLIGSGLEGNWPSGIGIGDFIVTGPKLQSGDCSGNPVGEVESFSQITFGSGLRPVKTGTCEWFVGGPTIQESGCNAQNPPQYLENLVIGSGLGFSGEGCVVTITGPQIQSGNCVGTPLGEPAYFDNLVFVSGMRVAKDGDDECEFHIAGPSIQESGCDNKKAPQALGNLVIGSGLKFTELPPDDPADCNILISGPQIQSGECDGTPLGKSVPFNNLIFVSGLRATRTEPDGCEWKISGPAVYKSGCGEKDTTPIPYEKLIIGSGITTTKDPGGEPCSVLITGPTIQSGDCAGSAVGEGEAFDNLSFVSGMRIAKDDECKWKIAGPTIQESGCGAPGSAIGLGKLIIGTGIHYSEHGDCGAVISGPKILATLCGNPAINSHFNQITFTSGLRVSQDGTEGAAACNFKVGGPTIQNKTCSANGNPVALSNLIIGSGLKMADGQDDCHYVVSGPKVMVTPCNYSSPDHVLETTFDKLLFKEGFHGAEVMDGSCKTIEIRGAKIRQSNACYGSYTSEINFEQAWFGDGLKTTLDPTRCRATIEGPQISLSSCGNVVDYGSFSKLTIGPGLSTAGTKCNVTIYGPKIDQESSLSACLGALLPAVAPFHFDQIHVGKGIKLTQLGACGAELSTAIYIAGAGCDNDMNPAILEKLNVGVGLKVVQDGQLGCYKITGPKIGTKGSQCDKSDKLDPAEFYNLIISDGLKVKETNPDICEFTLTGPTVSSKAPNVDNKEKWQDGKDCGKRVAPVTFCNLDIGEGLELLDSDEEDIRAGASHKIASCGIKIGKVDCGEVDGEGVVKDKQKWTNNIQIGKGLDFKNDDGTITISGPKILAADCGNTETTAKAFAKLTFAGGLKLTEDDAVKCEFKVEGLDWEKGICDPDNGSYDSDSTSLGGVKTLIVYDSLNPEYDSTNSNCKLKIKGPKISATNLCDDENGQLTAQHFKELRFGGGIAVKMDSYDNTGSENPDNTAGCGRYLISGPRWMKDGADIATSASSPSIMQVSYGLDIDGNNESCERKISWSGLPLGSVGCGITNDGCDGQDNVVQCLLVGDGLHLESTDSKQNTIKGSKIDGKFFKNLTIGDNLTLLTDGGQGGGTSNTCEYTLSGTMGETKVGAEGCTNDVTCAPLNEGCLIFSAGLVGNWVGEDFKVYGPTVGTKAGQCGPSVTAESFASLRFGSGLQLTKTNEYSCIYQIDACPKINIGETGCAVDSTKNKECVIHDCLVVGPGLNLDSSNTNQIKGTDFGGYFAKKFTLENLTVKPIDEEKTKDCWYTLSGTPPTKIRTGSNDNCGGGMSVSPCTQLSCLTVGSGLRIAEGGENGNYTIEACGGDGGGGGGCAGGLSTGVPVVTQVCCSGSSFIAVKRTLGFEDGCLVSVSADATCPTC